MTDRLPDSIVRINIPALEFFNKIAIVAEENGNVRAIQKHRPGPLHSADIIELRPAERSLHQGLFVQLIHTADCGHHVCIEVRARKWFCDDNLTYEIYVEALKFVFSKLLSNFNKKYGNRYRLVIQRKAACEPSLSPKVRKAFDLFVNTSNKSNLHQSDWNHFYYFCKLCHIYSGTIHEESVLKLLAIVGFTTENARNLATVFEHLRSFQKLRK